MVGQCPDVLPKLGTVHLALRRGTLLTADLGQCVPGVWEKGAWKEFYGTLALGCSNLCVFRSKGFFLYLSLFFYLNIYDHGISFITSPQAIL